MHTEHQVHELIVRIFTEEANAEERQIVSGWLAEKAENQILFNELKDIWLSSGIEFNPDHYEVEKAIQKFLKQTSRLNDKGVREKRFYQIARYAAILALVLMIPAAFYLGTKSTGPADTLTTVTCALGDKTSIVLPDSSRVFLNSGSKLTFSNNFKNGSRQLTLNGEAYFSVRKDPRNPFYVHTSAMDIEVLGTEFNLKAYDNEPVTSTTLVKGSLKVTGNNETTIIKPSQKLVFDKVRKQTAVEELVDMSPETEWKDGRLVFRNQSLAEMEHALERWFDVEVEFADDEVKNRRFTGTVEHESILEVISYFERSKYVACRIKDNTIIFSTK